MFYRATEDIYSITIFILLRKSFSILSKGWACDQNIQSKDQKCPEEYWSQGIIFLKNAGKQAKWNSRILGIIIASSISSYSALGYSAVIIPPLGKDDLVQHTGASCIIKRMGPGSYLTHLSKRSLDPVGTSHAGLGWKGRWAAWFVPHWVPQHLALGSQTVKLCSRLTLCKPTSSHRIACVQLKAACGLLGHPLMLMLNAV